MFDEGIMLFGGASGERVKPVGVMACAAVDGPSSHSVGHGIGHTARNRGLVVDGIDKGCKGVGGEIFKHLAPVEYIFTVSMFRTSGGHFYLDSLVGVGYLDTLKS